MNPHFHNKYCILYMVTDLFGQNSVSREIAFWYKCNFYLLLWL